MEKPRGRAIPEDLTAFITGATSGIGAAFARHLAAQGYNLALTGRRADQLNGLAAELRKKHLISTEVVISDLARLGGIEVVEDRIAALPDITLLINNAGFGVPGKFAENDVQGQLDMIQVHVIATVRLTHKVLPGMLNRKAGAIINVSSTAALVTKMIGASVTYASTKAYLNAFSESLHGELRGTGVRVQALCPGFTYTDFHDRPGFEHFKRSSLPKFMWSTSEQVVEASLRALEKDQVICVPGFMNKLAATFGRSTLIAWLAERFAPRPSLNK